MLWLPMCDSPVNSVASRRHHVIESTPAADEITALYIWVVDRNAEASVPAETTPNVVTNMFGFNYNDQLQLCSITKLNYNYITSKRSVTIRMTAFTNAIAMLHKGSIEIVHRLKKIYCSI